MTMNNFIFENSTKVFFGKGCVKEYLCCLTKAREVMRNVLFRSFLPIVGAEEAQCGINN